jgi:DNA polymerase-3 subunit alpha
MANEITKLLPKDPGSGRPSGKCTLLKEAKEQNDELIYVYDVVPEFRNLKTKFPEIFALAEQIEGLIEKRSVHAAGVLITEDELVNICPQQFSGKNKKLATAYDMNDAEKVGGVKFDFLQVKVLTIISKCIKTIEERYGTKVDIDHVDITDQKVIDLFARADVAAIFQFESDFMRNILKQMRVDCFEDIIAANALGRPGPMDNIPLYCERKTGMKKVEYPVPMLESILKPTYGIMVYQEQVMKIVRVLAGFTASESDTVRKAMGKKKKDILDKLENKFIKGCESLKTCPKEVAEKLWLELLEFSSYAFNLSLNKDTLIPLSNKSYKKIMDVKKGDKVLCFDGEKMVKTDVVALHDHGTLEGVEIEFDDGHKEICSINHKFLTVKGMVPLYKILKEGMEIISYESNSKSVLLRGKFPVTKPTGKAQGRMSRARGTGEKRN